jgi:hypothetical protein
MASKCEQNSFYIDFARGKIKISQDEKNYAKAKLEYRKNFYIMHDKFSGTDFYRFKFYKKLFDNVIPNNYPG